MSCDSPSRPRLASPPGRPRRRSVTRSAGVACRVGRAALIGVSLTGCSWLQALTGDPVDEAQRLAGAARDAEREGQLSEAGRLWREAADANPDDIEMHRELARVLMAQGDTGRAIEHLEYVVTRGSDDVQDFIHLAADRLEQGQPRAAERLLDRALELDPVSVQALLLRGRLAERDGRAEAALETYHRILACDPANPDAQIRIARLHLERSLPDRAAPLLRAVAQSDRATERQRIEARRNLGLAYAGLERWGDAVNELAASIDRRPDASADDWYRLAYARYRSGDVDGARRDIRFALRIDPRHENALAMVAFLGTGPPERSGTRFATRSAADAPRRQ